ncbi:NACHT domain-containing NTPase [Amycolatopsis sp. cg9]|uniref:NACHT domain-containing protein n=1 Tax=Amycolatopsis sp. cg9 TaxID=3238801 RepID=UPI003523C809
MRREPALTYEGALQILGHRDRRWLKRVDLVLGGVILGAGLASVINPVASVAAFAAVWGWVDQKNEAVRLVQEALNGLPAALRGSAGFERRRLVLAAHSTLVVAAYFEALREHIGEDEYALLEITETEKARLAAPGAEHLYRSEVPAPSARAGFDETAEHVRTWLVQLDERVHRFVRGLAVDDPYSRDVDTSVVDKAVRRYTSHYLKTAATVPEFRVWAELGEHAATRTKVEDLGEDLRSALHGHGSALVRLENLLTLMAPGAEPADDLRTAVRSVNRALLDEAIIPLTAARQYGRDIVFPPVGQIFVNPRYRFEVSAPDARPGDETWWEHREIHDDLDVRLVAHLASADAPRRPLLVLGHPGAGKSLLTKVIAARLPATSYTVVRVPLRHVRAHTPIHEQVQQALDLVTHRRVPWADLVEQSVETVRVVLLDGLDELLQQPHARLYGYLHDVMEFQRNEANQDRPVVVVVTSRTTVTDRVEIPDAIPIVKLEDFDHDQIGAWLTEWNAVNAAGTAAGRTRAFPLEAALRQRELTRQPLLLLMMALYVADPDAPDLEEQLSSAELYRRLLTHFAQREAGKSSTALSPHQIEQRVDDHLRRLSTAALGMFNRGRQSITAEELGADLAVLEKKTTDTTQTLADLGQRVIGEFFFVHTAQARLLAAAPPQHQYEFLHATFGEYLVASRVTEELAEVAHAAFSARRGIREPDDDLLFALLAHEVLAVRQPTLTFVAELAADLDGTERAQMLEVLDILIAQHRSRTGSTRYLDYRPRPVDHVRELAGYSANLVLLRVALGEDAGLPLEEFLHGPENPLPAWRSLLAFWRAGLADESWEAILSALSYRDGELSLPKEIFFTGSEPITYARLAGDLHAERVARFGEAFVDRNFYADAGDAMADIVEPWLALGLSNQYPGPFTSVFNKDAVKPPQEHLDSIFDRVEMLLKMSSPFADTRHVAWLVRWVMDHRADGRLDPYALTAAVLAHPGLLDELPELMDPRLYDAPGVPLMLEAEIAARGESEPPKLAELRYAIQRRQPGELWLNERLLAALHELLAAHRWPAPLQEPDDRSDRDPGFP